MKKKFKDNLMYYSILTILIIVIFCFFCTDFIKDEQEKYRGEHDFVRAIDIMSLSFNKNIYLNYEILKIQSSSTNLKRYSKGDLIYNFAQYEIIPSLNYLEKPNENEKLIDSFNNFLGFISDYNFLTIGLAENILVRNSNGYYYIEDNNNFIYTVKKNYIPKNVFNKIYYEYLNKENLEEHFVNLLYKVENINKKYTKMELREYIHNNYNNFYILNENDIVEALVLDLDSFSEYLYNNYISIENDIYGNIKKTIIKKIEVDEITFTFKFKKLQRVYRPISKYNNYSFQLDLKDIYKQLNDKNLPILYI